MAIDPICKMTVDEDTAKYVSEYKGKNITFVHLAVKKPLTKILINMQIIYEFIIKKE